MRSILKTVLAVGVAVSSLSTTAYAQSNNTLTQQSAWKDLWIIENTLPVWPKNLDAIEPNTQDVDWIENKSIPPSEWFGFRASDPDVTQAQWDAIASAVPQTQLTANTLAQWIVQWEQKARRLKLKLEPTTDPFKLLQMFSLFWNTNITNPNSIITKNDLVQVCQNLIDVTNGYRFVARNKIQILEPLMDAENLCSPMQTVINSKVKFNGRSLTWEDWPSVYGQLIKLQNSVTLTTQSNGSVVYNCAPSSTYSLGVDIAFTTPGAHVFSEYWFAGANFGKPNAFSEKFPAIYSPKQHLTSYKGHWTFENNKNDTMALFIEMPFNAWSWKLQTFCAAGGQLAVAIKKNGDVDSVIRVGEESENYPTEVIAYGH